MEWSKILFAVLTGGALVYLKASIDRAYKQKGCAQKLNAYLMHWKYWVLEQDQYYKVYYFGSKWYQKKLSVNVNTSDAAEQLGRIEDELKENLRDTINERMDEETIIELKELAMKASEKLSVLSDGGSPEGFLFKYIEGESSNLLNGRTFITDEEATLLNSYSTYKAVQLKMNLLSIKSQALDLLSQVKGLSAESDFQPLKDSLFQICWTGIKLAEGIEVLSHEANRIKNRSMLGLTLDNLILRY